MSEPEYKNWMLITQENRTLFEDVLTKAVAELETLRANMAEHPSIKEDTEMIKAENDLVIVIQELKEALEKASKNEQQNNNGLS